MASLFLEGASGSEAPTSPVDEGPPSQKSQEKVELTEKEPDQSQKELQLEPTRDQSPTVPEETEEKTDESQKEPQLEPTPDQSPKVPEESEKTTDESQKEPQLEPTPDQSSNLPEESEKKADQSQEELHRTSTPTKKKKRKSAGSELSARKTSAKRAKRAPWGSKQTFAGRRPPKSTELSTTYFLIKDGFSDYKTRFPKTKLTQANVWQIMKKKLKQAKNKKRQVLSPEDIIKAAFSTLASKEEGQEGQE